MRNNILIVFLLSTLAVTHAQDTVFFTEDQTDTSYYIPYANNALYMTYYENYTGRILANGYTYTYYPQDHNGYPARPWRLLFRQRCSRPITVYGIAAALATWATGEPDNHYYAWIVDRDTTGDTVTYQIIDSAKYQNITRFFHVSLPANHCDSLQSEKTNDTILKCYEFYFREPVTIDHDFCIGVYMDTMRFSHITHPDSVPDFISYYKLCLCQGDSIRLYYEYLPIPTPIDGYVGHYYRMEPDGYYPLIMAITVPPVEDTVPECGSVDSLWSVVEDSGRVSLSWNAASCAYRYEVNYGSEKPLMDTTVITSSTVLLLEGLMQGSLAYARVRPICHHVCPHHDTTDYGPWTDSLFFVVPTDTTPCPEVHGLAASWLDTDCVYITWTPVDDLSTYQLNYAEADSLFENGTFVNCPHPYAPVCGLSTNKAYKMRVRTPCTTGMASEGYGPWSDTLLFNPQPTGINDVEHDGIHIHPNPAATRLDIASEVVMQHVEINNPQGKTFYEQSHPTTHLTVNLDGWPAGGYMVRIQTPDGTVMKKLIVRR